MYKHDKCCNKVKFHTVLHIRKLFQGATHKSQTFDKKRYFIYNYITQFLYIDYSVWKEENVLIYSFDSSEEIRYNVSINNKIQEENKIRWKKFISGLENISGVSEDVLSGWKRSKGLGVDPYQKAVKRILTQKELTARKKNNDFFLDVSYPFLDNLFQFVKNSGFIVAISDRSGCLLKVFGDDYVKDRVSKGNWIEGADWSENSAGNNIIGTALVCDKPITFAGYEHYCHCSHYYAGAGAPIHNSDGKLIGAIAIAGQFERLHYHTLGMIVAAAKGIEMHFSLKKAFIESEIANQYKDLLVDAINEGIITTDEKDFIIFCNSNAEKILSIKPENIIGKQLKDILPSLYERKSKGKLHQSSDIDVIFKINNKYIKCYCAFNQIIVGNKLMGMVLVFSDFSQVVKLTNKITNKYTKWTFENMIGNNKEYLELVKIAKKASLTDGNVLLLGESGTGKDVFAQAIHNGSYRKDGPFVAVNCAAIPKDLINSELFGYTGGAFTGANKEGSKGKIESADGGTLFLDEIGEMPLEQQSILLRVLETHLIERVGSSNIVPVNVRIIAATNKDLLEEVKKNHFRLDLYYRLNLFTIKMIPLRRRIDDIKQLSYSILEHLAYKTGKKMMQISDEAIMLLYNYDWPGNIRELQNIIERATLISDGETIDVRSLQILEDINPERKEKNNNIKIINKNENNINDSVKNFEADLITNTLEQNEWNVSKSSLKLGISRTTLYRKLEAYNIEIKRNK